MLEKLLSLLLHAKGGAVATVLVLGASGALVTATVENGMTTVTVAQANATTTGSETTTGQTKTNTTVTETILALFNRTNSEEGSTEPATGGNGCSDEAHARNEQMKRVNDASKTHREEVSALGKDADKTSENKKLVKDADTAIKDIRQAAVKAIHATFDCDKDNDEDEDEDQDEDNDDEVSSTDTTSTTTSTGPSIAFSGDDAKAIADLAISAMDLEVTNLKADLAAAETTTNATNTADKGKSEDKAKSGKSDNGNKGKGNGKGRSGGND
jgi:hypothetical protein